MSADPSSSEQTSPVSDTPASLRVHPLDWAAQAGAGADVVAELERRIRQRRRGARRLVGSSLLVVALTLLTWRIAVPEQTPAAMVAARPIVVIEPERQTLPDGTVVELKPGSAIVPHFSASGRRVVLLRGEAHFEVIKDALRPFIVAAAGVEVRAVGTAFTVELGEKAMEVVVTEGRVAVEKTGVTESPREQGERDATAERPATGPTAVAMVGAGARMVVTVDPTVPAQVPRIEPISVTALAERLAWRVPRVELSGTPLSEALVIFNRHATRRLVLTDPKLGRLQISGVLRTDNVEALLHLLQEEHAIVATQRGDGELHLAKVR